MRRHEPPRLGVLLRRWLSGLLGLSAGRTESARAEPGAAVGAHRRTFAPAPSRPPSRTRPVQVPPPTRPAAEPSLSASLRDRAALRRAIVINELLRKPVALRSGRRPGRRGNVRPR